MKITINIEEESLKIDEISKDRKIIEPVSSYAKWFNNTCMGWINNPEYNLTFLRCQQNYMNDILRKNGHVFLNDVYQALGINKTQAGQLVGWVYDEKNPVGDNYIDFGLMNKNNSDFVNGLTSDALLDFNVDGVILDRI